MSLQLRIFLLIVGLCLLAVVGAAWAIVTPAHTPGEAIAVAAALLILAGLGAAWFLSGLRRPLALLQDAAARLESGEPVDVPDTGVAELNDVASALRLASEQIRESNRKLEASTAEANRQARAAQARLDKSAQFEAVGRLTRGIAHDFNNLLQTLNMGLQVLDRRVDDTQSRSMIVACQRATFRARTLIQQLQSFSRRQPLQPVAIDLRDSLLKMEGLLAKALPPDIALHVNVSSDLWPTRTDPGQFELALLNLLFNARDAMPNGGRIVVSAYNARNTTAGDVVCVEVADVGSGIDPEVLPHVFDPFFTTKGKGHGAGLGLSQVYNLANGSGGNVEIESAPEVGTVVRVTLPKSAESPASATQRPPMPVSAVPIRVLFVEDDPLVSKVAASALTGLGFDIVHVHNADDALQLLEDGEQVEAVFSDIVMPGRMSGIDLAEAIAAHWPELPIVLATGYGEKTPRPVNARVMTKPYLIEDVARALHDALARPSAAREPTA